MSYNFGRCQLWRPGTARSSGSSEKGSELPDRNVRIRHFVKAATHYIHPLRSVTAKTEQRGRKKMKFRTDFVTNSSDTSYISFNVKNQKLYDFIESLGIKIKSAGDS